MQVQMQIRQNAEEISSYLTDMRSWEKTMMKKDGSSSSSSSADTKSSKKLKVRECGTVNVSTESLIPPPSSSSSSSSTSSNTEKGQTAAKHTYDVGYKKWETFDVNAALDDLENQGKRNKSIDDHSDDDAESNTSSNNSNNYNSKNTNSNDKNGANSLNPATLVRKQVAQRTKSSNPVVVPRARGTADKRDAELVERERGNEEFKNGNFATAVKCYTKCLGMKVKNFLAFSNRALAYIKMKDYIRAENDCNCALSIESNHIKSLLRRATARCALCKYRAAIQDILIVIELDPTNKQARTDLQKTRELLRNAVSRAPYTPVVVTFSSVDDSDGVHSSVSSGSVINEVEGPDYEPSKCSNISMAETVTNTVTTENDDCMKKSVSFNPTDSVKLFTKISITDDSDNDDESDANTDSITSLSHTHTTSANATITTAAIAAATATVAANTTSTSAIKSSLKAKTTSPQKSKSTAVPTSYEIEKRLQVTNFQDEKQLAKVLSTLSPNSAAKIFSGLLETDVLYLFLSAVHQYYGTYKHDNNRIIEWFTAVSNISTFNLMVSLLSEAQAASIKQMLMSSSASERLLSLYGVRS